MLSQPERQDPGAQLIKSHGIEIDLLCQNGVQWRILPSCGAKARVWRSDSNTTGEVDLPVWFSNLDFDRLVGESVRFSNGLRTGTVERVWTRSKLSSDRTLLDARTSLLWSDWSTIGSLLDNPPQNGLACATRLLARTLDEICTPGKFVPRLDNETSDRKSELIVSTIAAVVDGSYDAIVKPTLPGLEPLSVVGAQSNHVDARLSLLYRGIKEGLYGENIVTFHAGNWHHVSSRGRKSDECTLKIYLSPEFSAVPEVARSLVIRLAYSGLCFGLKAVDGGDSNRYDRVFVYFREDDFDRVLPIIQRVRDEFHGALVGRLAPAGSMVQLADGIGIRREIGDKSGSREVAASLGPEIVRRALLLAEIGRGVELSSPDQAARVLEVSRSVANWKVAHNKVKRGSISARIYNDALALTVARDLLGIISCPNWSEIRRGIEQEMRNHPLASLDTAGSGQLTISDESMKLGYQRVKATTFLSYRVISSGLESAVPNSSAGLAFLKLFQG